MSATSMNLSLFAQLLLRHATAARMDREVRRLLEATARGELPSVWGPVHHD